MTVVATTFTVLLLILLLVQVHWANRFVALYKRTDKPSDYSPHVGVILALRGADPFLENCLRGLFSQNYASHEIRIVIDSEVDPAFAIVDRVIRDTGADNVIMEILDVCQETSSLKNSALIQGIQGCSDACEAFAWLDSDTVPHPDWLSCLIRPLADEQTGVSCGIRWYAPPTSTIANYVRHIWNAAAVLQMVELGIGWGGAFAVRKSVVCEAELEAKWRLGLVEDTLASDVVREGGRQVRFVPECTMSNPESASLRWCVSFVTRQLQGLRYYHRAWQFVLYFGIVSGAAILGCTLILANAIFSGDTVSALITGFGIVTFGTVAGWLMYRSERVVSGFFEGGSDRPLSNPLLLIVAAPLAQIVHLIALVRACCVSQVTWRGIKYTIRSGMDLTRVNYQPYMPDTDLVQHSL